MALLPDFALSPELEEEIRHVVSRVPDAELIDYARLSPLFQAGGFRTGKPSAIRDRVLQLALGQVPIDERLRCILALGSRGADMLQLFDPVVIFVHGNALLALFGRPVVLVGMLLDTREEVRAKAVDWCRFPAERDQEITPEEGAIQLSTALQQLNGRIEAALPPDLKGPLMGGRVSCGGQDMDRLRRELSETQGELRKARHQAGRSERLAAQLETARQETARASDGRAAAEAEARRLRHELETVTAELRRERDQASLSVETRLEAHLAREFAGWLKDGRQWEAESRRPEREADLTARAEAALARQAGADRISGSRRSVQERLDRMEALAARCRDALGQAFRPLPELSGVLEEVDTETRRLRMMLGLDPERPFEHDLAAAVNSAGLDDLPGLRQAIDCLGRQRVFDSSALQRLNGVVLRRQAALTATAAVPATEAGRGTAIGRALAGVEPAILLIDGHNTLFSLQARYMPPQERGGPDRAGRNRLVADIVKLTRDRPACRAWIVFDGPEASEENASANVRVSYSGGTGEDRADRIIADTARFLRQAEAASVVVVTNDGALSARVSRLGATILSPGELLGLVG